MIPGYYPQGRLAKFQKHQGIGLATQVGAGNANRYSPETPRLCVSALMVFLNYHLEGTIFLLFSDHNSQLRNTLLQFNVNQMNVPGSIMLLACFLVLNCSSGNADFQMIFYDSRGQITNRLTITDIRSVRWDDQCYFISDDKLNDIMKLNLQGGRIEMIFKNDVLASIEAFSVYSSRLPSGYFTPLGPNDRLVLDGGSLCVRSLKDNPNEELLRNEDSRVFLVDAGLLEEICCLYVRLAFENLYPLK